MATTTAETGSGSSNGRPYLFLTLVRHGETVENKTGILQGQTDTFLSDKGIEQAQLAGSKLCDEHFSHVFSSDLKRARKTAEEIVEKSNFSSLIKIVEDSRLQERCYGVAEGSSLQKFNEMAANNSMKTSAFTPKGGETLAEVKKRATEFLNSIIHEIGSSHINGSSISPAQNDDNCVSSQIMNGLESSEHEMHEEQSHLANVLIVSHGGVIRQLLYYFVDDLASEFPSGFNRKVRFVSPNTGLSRFKIIMNEQTKLPEFVKCICLHNTEHLVKAE
ncbi:hypothetical protein OS493_008091 [Desmophyllum pertusum]|uniref:Fructose-2,6-bisphosphatase TIGAR n=1 Tax=Desmophyllum pertusum TaxID=174260 RepID=A0A9W9YF60_9CNID|nr:hypothetical protein OS493_008091 [Desmophyllum pertusum]